MVRRLALSHGMPADARPSDIIAASALKRERERGLAMSLAISIFNGIGVCLAGGSTDAVLTPFLSPAEREDMAVQREAREQEAAQRAQIAMLRKMSERMNHGR